MKKILLALAVAAIISTESYQHRSAVREWMRDGLHGRLPDHDFIEKTKALIKEDETILFILEGEQIPATLTRFYPRPIQIKTWAQARNLAATQPDAWVVSYGEPFVPEKAFAVRARDLH